MRTPARTISLLILIALLLCLLGCDGTSGNTTPTTTPSTAAPTTEATATPTESTSPEIDAAGLCTDALTQLQDMQNVKMTVTLTETMVVGGETFENTFRQVITYLRIGTEEFSATVEEAANYAGYETDIAESYVGGNAYATVYGGNFTAPMTAEEFMARYISPCPVDISLYGSVTATEDGTISLTDAAALESWLATEATELICASASLTLSESGAVTQADYTANYRNSCAEMTTTVTVLYEDASKSLILAPADAEDYIGVEYLDAARTVEEIYGYLCAAQSVTVSSADLVVLQAAGVMKNTVTTVNTYGSGNNLKALIETDQYILDGYTGDEIRYSLEESYNKGVYTYTLDDADPIIQNNTKPDLIVDYVLDINTCNILDCSTFDDARCIDLGSLLVVVFSGGDDLGKAYADEICYNLYNDADILNDLASDYKTNMVGYYVAVDKYLGLPTATGMYFEGSHTIDGVDYLISWQLDQSIYLASLDSYKAITDTAAPDTEPEEKATPLFYHVTGSDGQEMWLLGTIHIGDDRTGYLPQEIYDAFAASDALALECDTEGFDKLLEEDEELADAVSANYFYADGSETYAHIEDETLYQSALLMLQATGNYNYNTPYMKAAVWSQSIDNYFIRMTDGLSSDKGVDNRLYALALEQEKEILEVESSLFQVQMLTGWSDPLQELMLGGSVSTDGLQYAADTQALYEMWCAGDEAALIEYLSDGDLSELTEEELELYNEYTKAMSSDRNAGMLQVAIEYLEGDKTVFYAVGLAHLLAEDGLVNTLRDAGYTVELVEYQ